MANIKHSDIPFAIAPGETIREELAARGQSVADLAKAIEVNTAAAESLVDGELALTPELAAKLGAFFGTSAAVWSSLESQYREALAELKPVATEEAIAERQDVSGKFVVRLPKSLHVALKDLAETEGISINQMVVAMLAEGVGRSKTRLALPAFAGSGEGKTALAVGIGGAEVSGGQLLDMIGRTDRVFLITSDIVLASQQRNG